MSESNPNPVAEPDPKSLLDKVIYFCLTQKIVVFLFCIVIVAGGIFVAPFDWDVGGISRQPVATDAIPDR